MRENDLLSSREGGIAVMVGTLLNHVLILL